METHFVVEKLQIGCTLILDLANSVLLVTCRIVTSPVGILISPLIILAVIVSRFELEIVAQSLLAV